MKVERFAWCCGVDEVGRGALAGPVVAAAVVLRRGLFPSGLKDSKKLSKFKRKKVYENLRNFGDFGIGLSTPKEIEKELAKIQSSVPVMKVLQELTSTPGVNIQNLKSDVGAFGGMGQTINVNTVNKAGDTQNIQNNKTIANNQVSNVNLPFAMTKSAYPF